MERFYYQLHADKADDDNIVNFDDKQVGWGSLTDAVKNRQFDDIDDNVHC